MLKKTDTPAPLAADPMEDARRARLTYVSDSESGIRRKRSGKGFAYVATDGSRITDGETRARIRALVIPPAWEDVWICPSPDGHIQATGRDQAESSGLGAFAEALPGLRAQVDRDLSRQGVPLERAVASIVWLLDRTMIRIGNVAYRRDNNSFGLTTLENRHVNVEGASLR